MKKYYLLSALALGLGATSLTSCSRASYTFTSPAPAYLGSAPVRPAAATPATTASVAPATPALAETTPASQPSRHTARRAAASAAASAAAPTPSSAAKPVILTHKALKQELKRQLAAAPSATTAKGKSQLVAAILCFFLGGLGVHDFYLGRVGKGILQIFLSLILVGFILVIIDFVRILIGTEKPKDGEYAKKLGNK